MLATPTPAPTLLAAAPTAHRAVKPQRRGRQAATFFSCLRQPSRRPDGSSGTLLLNGQNATQPAACVRIWLLRTASALDRRTKNVR